MGKQGMGGKYPAPSNRRGYFGIGVYHPKTEENIGTLWRHANNFEADFVFTIGRRYKKQASDTAETYRHKPLFHYRDFDDFYEHLPYDCRLVAVELDDNSTPLTDFEHPERVVYLLGAEDSGLPQDVLKKAHFTVEIPTARPQSMNVAVSGTLVMHDRFVKTSRSVRAASLSPNNKPNEAEVK